MSPRPLCFEAMSGLMSSLCLAGGPALRSATAAAYEIPSVISRR